MWEEEPVLMADGGRTPLREVKVGNRVVNGFGRPTEVVAVYEQGRLPTLRITVGSGRTVVAALDHPFLTPEGWVEAQHLSVGSVLALLPRPEIEHTSTRSLEEFRLAGYFIGDGAVGRGVKAGPNGSCHAEFSCADPVELEDFRACVATLGGTVVSRRLKNHYGTTGLQPWLRAVGLNGGTSYTKRVPAWVLSGSAEQIGHFLGAYFACDGWIGNGSREVVYYSVCKELLEDVQHLLLRLGINTTLKAKNGKYLEARHRSYLLRLRQQDDAYGRFLSRVPVFHSRKAMTLAAIAANSRFRRFDESHLPDAIVTIEPAGELPCRCITVADGDSFTTRDLVVHNSQAADYMRRLAGYTVRTTLEARNAPGSNSPSQQSSKITRFSPFSAQAEAHNVSLLRGEWNKRLCEELEAFPEARHDDSADATARAFNELTVAHRPAKVAPLRL